MADITIVDADSAVKAILDSKDGTTVGELLEMIDAGVLTKDGVLKASKSYILEPGTYTWIEKQQQQQAPTVDPEKESMRKRILALEMQGSRAVSYADYFNEKSAQGRIRQWSPPMFSDSELPTPLRGQLPQGGEKETVKPFWKSILEENKLVSAFSNGYEVGYLGPKIPDVAFSPSQSSGLRLANMWALEIAKAASGLAHRLLKRGR